MGSNFTFSFRAAYLKVAFQLVIDPAYHPYAAYFGLPMTIMRQVRIRFNGAYVGYTYSLAVTARPDRWAADRRSVCIPVPTRMIRFAKLRKRLNPTSYADNSLGGKTPLPSPATIFPCTNAPSDPEAPCPGLNDVQVVWTGGDALYGINHVLNQVGPLKLESAMEPIVLVGGCCGEYGNFWNSGELRSGFYSFEQRMKEIGAPYAHLAYGEAIFGAIDIGSNFLVQNLDKIARAYGSPWLHLVAHSKGGLNARYMLINQAKALSDLKVGILSVTTLQTPHRGSVGALYQSLRYAQPEADAGGFLLNLVLSKKIKDEDKLISGDKTKRTTPDLTPENVANALPGEVFLPAQTKLIDSIGGKSVNRPLVFRSLVSDANFDKPPEAPGVVDQKDSQGRTTNFYRRRITTNEVVPFPTSAYGFGLERVLEELYNTMGQVAGVRLESRIQTVATPHGTTGSITRYFIVPTSLNSDFQLNDFVVTTSSQAFFNPPSQMSAYSLFANKPIPNPNPDPDATNHNACANNKVADEVIKFVKQSVYKKP